MTDRATERITIAATPERYFGGRCISSLYLPSGGSKTMALQ